MLDEIEKEILQRVVEVESHISCDELALFCDVSANTVRKKIDIINGFLAPHGCIINTKVSSGFNFEVLDKHKAYPYIDDLLKNFRRFRYLRLSKNSSAYIIIKHLLVSDAYIPIEQLMNNLYCSKSTILRTLDSVRYILELYNLKLKNKRNHGLYIVGDELSKRLCLILLHKIYKHELTHSKNDKFNSLFFLNTEYYATIRKIVYKAFAANDFSVQQVHIHQVVNMIILNRTRINYEKNLLTIESQKNEIKNMDSYLIAKEIYQSLPSYFNERVTEITISVLAVILKCVQSFTSSSQIALEQRVKENKEINEMVEFICMYFDVDSIFDDEFKEEFVCYYHSLKIKNYFNFPEDREKLASATKNGLFTADICSLFALFYYTKYQIVLKEEELCDAYFIFNSALLRNQKFFRRKNALVVSRYGLPYARNIVIRFKQNFSKYFDKIDVVEFNEIFQFTNNEYDLLISDYEKIKDIQYPIKELVTVNIQHLENDFLAFQMYILNMMNQKALNIFQEKNFHKSKFINTTEVYDAIYKVLKDQIEDKERFFKDLELRNSFVAFERMKGIVLITSLAYRLKSPIFEVFINEKSFVWNRNRSNLFIFYGQGDGSKENVQIISYLLKQFMHQNESYINLLYRRKYKDVTQIFRIE